MFLIICIIILLKNFCPSSSNNKSNSSTNLTCPKNVKRFFIYCRFDLLQYINISKYIHSVCYMINFSIVRVHLKTKLYRFWIERCNRP